MRNVQVLFSSCRNVSLLLINARKLGVNNTEKIIKYVKMSKNNFFIPALKRNTSDRVYISRLIFFYSIHLCNFDTIVSGSKLFS